MFYNKSSYTSYYTDHQAKRSKQCNIVETNTTTATSKRQLQATVVDLLVCTHNPFRINCALSRSSCRDPLGSWIIETTRTTVMKHLCNKPALVSNYNLCNYDLICGLVWTNFPYDFSHYLRCIAVRYVLLDSV